MLEKCVTISSNAWMNKYEVHDVEKHFNYDSCSCCSQLEDGATERDASLFW